MAHDAPPGSRLDPLPLDELLLRLRARGMDLGVDAFLAVGTLLERWDGGDIDQLRTAIAAVLATDPEEVALVEEVFDALYPRTPPPPPPPDRTPATPKTWFWGAAILAMLVLVALQVVPWALWQFPDPDRPSGDDDTVLGDDDSAGFTVPVEALLDRIFPPVTDRPSGPPPQLPEAPSTLHRTEILAGVALVALLSFLALSRARTRRAGRDLARRAWQDRLDALPPPQDYPLRLPQLAPPFPATLLDDVATEISRRLAGRPLGRELDVPRTLDATLAAGLAPSIVWKPVTSAVPLVILRDTSDEMRPWRRMVDALLEGLETRGVWCEVWTFRGAAETLTRADAPVTRGIEVLARSRGEAPVLVLSTGSGLVGAGDDTGDGPTGWARALSRWRFGAWLHPDTDRSTWRAALDTLPIPAWPMTPEGLIAAAEQLADGDPSTAPTRTRASRPVTARDVDRLRWLLSLTPRWDPELAELLRQRFAPGIPQAAVALALESTPLHEHPGVGPSEGEVHAFLAEVLDGSEPRAGTVGHLQWRLDRAMHGIHLDDADDAVATLATLAAGPLAPEVDDAMARAGVRGAGDPATATASPTVIPTVGRNLERRVVRTIHRREKRAATLAAMGPGASRWTWPSPAELLTTAALALVLGGLAWVLDLGREEHFPHQEGAYELALEPAGSDDETGTFYLTVSPTHDEAPRGYAIYRDQEPVDDLAGRRVPGIGGRRLPGIGGDGVPDLGGDSPPDLGGDSPPDMRGSDATGTTWYRFGPEDRDHWYQVRATLQPEGNLALSEPVGVPPKAPPTADPIEAYELVFESRYVERDEEGYPMAFPLGDVARSASDELALFVLGVRRNPAVELPAEPPTLAIQRGDGSLITDLEGIQLVAEARDEIVDPSTARRGIDLDDWSWYAFAPGDEGESYRVWAPLPAGRLAVSNVVVVPPMVKEGLTGPIVGLTLVGENILVYRLIHIEDANDPDRTFALVVAPIAGKTRDDVPPYPTLHRDGRPYEPESPDTWSPGDRGSVAEYLRQVMFPEPWETQIPADAIAIYRMTGNERGHVYQAVGVAEGGGKVVSGYIEVLDPDAPAEHRPLRWVRIPGGSFEMGKAGSQEASPVHTVALRSFLMSETEVTVGQWGECVAAGACQWPDTNARQLVDLPSVCNSGPTGPKPGLIDHPLNCVSWREARIFATWTGGSLPSEAQWEYAARADRGYLYAGSDELGEVGWPPGDDYDLATQRVAQKRSNTWGLYDMSCNVSEFVEDDWHDSYRSAPTNGEAWVDSGIDIWRVARGGGSFEQGSNCEVTAREKVGPGRYGETGFRVVLPVELPGGDRDGDGVPDLRDACPDDPEDVDGWVDDDGCPDPDNDGDGIPDSEELCPNDPEDLDGFEDIDGCPDPDNDGDGLLDIDDLCPDEREVFNRYHDEDGCPDRLPRGIKSLPMSLSDATARTWILWAVADRTSDDLDPDSKALLEDLSLVLMVHEETRVVLAAHSNGPGTREQHWRRGESLAESVAESLILWGIDVDRVTAENHGDQSPYTGPALQEGTFRDRRVEFRIFLDDEVEADSPSE